MLTPFQKIPRFEDRKLLDLAHRVKNCVNCQQYVENGCVPAHSNLLRHGRGKDYKAHDHHHAALCPACHFWYDEGTKGRDPSGIWEPTREDKALFILTMKDRTLDIYFTNGWIVVLVR